VACLRRTALTVLLISLWGGPALRASIPIPNEAINFKALGHWPNGACYAVEALGHTMVAGNGAALEIVYAADPEAPVRVGRTVLPSEIYALDVAGAYAYAGIISYGLAIIDISDPDAPRQVSVHPVPARIYEIEVRGDTAYLAAGAAGLRIVDIRDRARPRDVARYTAEGSAFEVDLHGDLAYVSYGQGGLHVLDIGQPENPQLVSASMPWPYLTGMALADG